MPVLITYLPILIFFFCFMPVYFIMINNNEDSSGDKQISNDFQNKKLQRKNFETKVKKSRDLGEGREKKR